MFDDPKKDLKRLEQQLLAMEQPQEEYTDEDNWFADEEDWLDDELRQVHQLMGDPPVQQNNLEDIFAFLEEDTVPEEAPAVYADPPVQPKPEKDKKKKKEKGVGGLVFLACLETLGIIAVLLWWVIWLL